MAKVTCPACSGAGAVANVITKKNIQCPICGGNGLVDTSGLGDLYFEYIFNPAALLANQQGVQSIVNIQNDADFEVHYIKSNSTGLFSVTLFDQLRNRQLSSAAINGENGTGTGQLPLVLRKPWILLRTSVVVATFNDRSGAGNTIQLTLGGYKQFGITAQ